MKSAQARADEAGATASRLEADLEGLSSAYNHLEAHAFALETRVRELEADTKPGKAPMSWPNALVLTPFV